MNWSKLRQARYFHKLNYTKVLDFNLTAISDIINDLSNLPNTSSTERNIIFSRKASIKENIKKSSLSHSSSKPKLKKNTLTNINKVNIISPLPIPVLKTSNMGSTRKERKPLGLLSNTKRIKNEHDKKLKKRSIKKCASIKTKGKVVKDLIHFNITRSRSPFKDLRQAKTPNNELFNRDRSKIILSSLRTASPKYQSIMIKRKLIEEDIKKAMGRLRNMLSKFKRSVY